MSRNSADDAFFYDAVKRLEPQYRALHPDYKGPFGGRYDVPLLIVREGPDAGKLTVGLQSENGVIPHPHIIPADCYNRIRPGEDLASAVNREIRESTL